MSEIQTDPRTRLQSFAQSSANTRVGKINQLPLAMTPRDIIASINQQVGHLEISVHRLTRINSEISGPMSKQDSGSGMNAIAERPTAGVVEELSMLRNRLESALVRLNEEVEAQVSVFGIER